MLLRSQRTFPCVRELICWCDRVDFACLSGAELPRNRNNRMCILSGMIHCTHRDHQIGSLCSLPTHQHTPQGPECHPMVPSQRKSPAMSITLINLLHQDSIVHLAHRINKLQKLPPLPTGTPLDTLDVPSLYTNILHNEGMRAVNSSTQERLNSYQQQTNAT